jgi:hypothetical protein
MRKLRLVTDRPSKVEALKACLEYLYEEALNVDKPITANLIGAAAESLDRDFSEKSNRPLFPVVSGREA